MSAQDFFESLSLKLTNLEAKFDRNSEELKDRIRELEVKMHSFKAEIIKWMFLFWVGQLIVVAGLIKWLR